MITRNNDLSYLNIHNPYTKLQVVVVCVIMKTFFNRSVVSLGHLEFALALRSIGFLIIDNRRHGPKQNPSAYLSLLILTVSFYHYCVKIFRFEHLVHLTRGDTDTLWQSWSPMVGDVKISIATVQC